MARDPKSDWYWPLGELEYQHEIRDFFSDEAEALGVITILWNRQELKLRTLFLRILASRRPGYAEAIWERQPTHQAKRDLLALAGRTAKLTKRQTAILEIVIDKTKVMADRRNELLHAEYVVHGRTDTLHAKVKSPRSSKPPKHQRVAISDLQRVIDDMEELLQLTDVVWAEFASRKYKAFIARMRKFAEDRGLSLENRQTGSDLPSVRQRHDEGF
jgi:hypothetical protein